MGYLSEGLTSGDTCQALVTLLQHDPKCPFTVHFRCETGANLVRFCRVWIGSGKYGWLPLDGSQSPLQYRQGSENCALTPVLEQRVNCHLVLITGESEVERLSAVRASPAIGFPLKGNAFPMHQRVCEANLGRHGAVVDVAAPAAEDGHPSIVDADGKLSCGVSIPEQRTKTGSRLT